jgi:ATP-dependent exoDNAse (exonuclease V) beta subunit
MPAVATASLGRILELGPRLAVKGKPDMGVLGEALHGIYAAILTHPRDADDCVSLCRALLQRHGLGGAVDARAVLDSVQRFREKIAETFFPKQVLAEWPVRMVLDNGQRLTGWVDVLVETKDGWVIIDHKSFPGAQSAWPEKAMSFSGQVDAYRSAVEKATGSPVVGQWIHFSVGGGLVEVQF